LSSFSVRASVPRPTNSKAIFVARIVPQWKPWPWSFPSAGISRSSSRSIKLWVGIRVHDDTIVVTYYNAPNVESLRAHYQDLPARLPADKINPCIPWLYNFKLDFRFK